MVQKVIFQGSRDQNLDISGAHYGIYHTHVNGSLGAGNEYGNDVIVGVDKFHGVCTNGAGGGDADVGKGNDETGDIREAGATHHMHSTSQCTA